MARMLGVRFMPPKSFSKGRPLGPPRWVILHYTAGHEGPDAAENGAAYDARRTDGTSAHFHCDSDSIVQCVDTDDRAHTALRHGNMWGIQIEMAGTRQTREQWLDKVSRETIRNAAKITAWALAEHGLPLRQLPVNGLASSSARGIADHNACTVSFPDDGGTHTDVGPGFPWDVFLADVEAELNGDDDMAEFTDDHARKLNEVHRLLTEGKRINDPQTAGNGVPISWLPRVVHQLGLDLDQLYAEVDGVEEADAELLAAIRAVPAGDPAALVDVLLARLPIAVLDALAARLVKPPT